MSGPRGEPKPGDLHVLTLSGGVEMRFRYIPPTGPRGFRMGSRSYDPDEEPVHRVVIDPGFWLGETPVTQEQFSVWTNVVVEKHENQFKAEGGALLPHHPAESLTWRQAVRFCAWLEEACWSALPLGVVRVCLPTEAEWEWARRGNAGSETEFFNGDGAAALAEAGWYVGNSNGRTHPVGEKAANEFSLRDMHGNVWEWCHDRWGKDWVNPRPVYRQALDEAPDGGRHERGADYASGLEAMLADSQLRVLRGGSWENTPAPCHSAFRYVRPPGLRFSYVGFRVCLAPGPAASGAEPKPERAEAEAETGARAGGRSPEATAPGDAGAALDLRSEVFAGEAGRKKFGPNPGPP